MMLIIFRNEVKINLFYYFGIDCACKTRTACFRYDVFVIYPKYSTEFVENEIMPIIEKYENVKAIYMWRDMYAGHSITGNVKYFANKSAKVLYVTDIEKGKESKQYIDLTWIACEYLLEKNRVSDVILLSKAKNVKGFEQRMVRAFTKRRQHIIYGKTFFVQSLVYSNANKTSTLKQHEYAQRLFCNGR